MYTNIKPQLKTKYEVVGHAGANLHTAGYHSSSRPLRGPRACLQQPPIRAIPNQKEKPQWEYGRPSDLLESRSLVMSLFFFVLFLFGFFLLLLSSLFSISPSYYSPSVICRPNDHQISSAFLTISNVGVLGSSLLIRLRSSLVTRLGVMGITGENGWYGE